MPTSRAAKRHVAAEVKRSAGRSSGREAMMPTGSTSAAGSERCARAWRSSRMALWPRVLGPRAHSNACDPHDSKTPPQQAHCTGSAGPAVPRRKRTAET
eukprot:10056535-Karenia_brevis.AAC.1